MSFVAASRFAGAKLAQRSGLRGAQQVPVRTFVKRTNPKQFMDHHAFMVISSLATFGQLVNIAAGRGWFRSMLRTEPQLAISIGLGCVAFIMPAVVPEIRKKMGYDTEMMESRVPGPARW